MSGHATTIRRTLNFYCRESRDLRGAHDALDALVAENQRLRDALTAIDTFPISEELSAGYHFAEVRSIARAALRHRQEKHGGETREYAACVHRWRYFPVLDMNPEQHSRECVLCGLSQSRSGDTSLGDGLVRPGTEWKPAARVEQHR